MKRLKGMFDMAGGSILTGQDVLFIWYSPNKWRRLFLHAHIFLSKL